MTRRATLLLLTLAAAGGAAANAEGISTAEGPANAITVGCDQIIGRAKTGHDAGYRVVLGIVSAPPASLGSTVHVPEYTPFPYWRKAGMVIHAGRQSVTVSVPAAYARRVRIGWGNPATPTTTVRFSACPSFRGWIAYAGGFFLRARSACVPLTFAVGRRHTTLRFGLGRRC